MGLLSRVAGRSDSKKTYVERDSSLRDPSLDEMGKTLAERIRRLPENENTPYTALSLLKAYANFHSGICLSLKDGVYSSYLSIGAETGELSIPQEEVWSEDRAHQKYFRFEFDGESDFDRWIFPLDPSVLNASGPWASIMILETDKANDQGSAFNPGSVSEVIADVAGIFCSHQDAEETDTEEVYAMEAVAVEADEEEAEEEEPFLEELEVEEPAQEEPVQLEEIPQSSVSSIPVTGEMEIIMNKIAQFQDAFGDFNCVVFDGSEEDYLDFSRKVTEIVNTLGTVIPLTPARPLVLIPNTVDCELISHRLARSLNSTPIISFESDSAEKAINRIKPLIENGSGKDQVFTFQI